MKFKTLNGREVNKTINKWLVKWDKPCKSQFQFRVKQFFKKYWEHCCVGEEFSLPGAGGILYVDLINFSQKIAVESHGQQHQSFNKFFHDGKRTNFLSSIKRDIRKITWLETNGFKVIEVNIEDEKKLSLKWIKDNFDIDLI